MRALVYRNTRHSIPNWVPFHETERRGIAYETDTHFVHMFGKDYGLWVISTGLTATERKKSGTLRDWVERTFGAEEIQETETDVGHSIEGVWRPGLYFDDEVFQALATTNVEVRYAEQALLLLVQRLDELLHFVEPSPSTMNTHSHKARELLILASTEIENYWKKYLQKAGVNPPQSGRFTTNDYVNLKSPLFLDEFEVTLPRYSDIPPIRPFHGWERRPSPTTSLPWYDAYNKTKHDRGTHFAEASLWNCLQAVSANLILFCVGFGPFRLFHGSGTLAAFFNQLFSIELKDCRPTSFYAPAVVTLPPNHSANLTCFGAQDLVQPRVVEPFRL